MEKYIEIVKHYYSFNLIILTILALIFGIISIVVYKKKKNKRTVSFCLLIIVLILGALGFYSYDLFRDIGYIKRGQIEIVEFTEAGFNTKYNDNADFWSTPVVAITSNKKELYLNSINKFPSSIKNGKIVYLEKSRLILDYSGEVNSN